MGIQTLRKSEVRIIRQFDEQAGLVMFQLWGPVTCQHILDTALDHFPEHPTPNVIWDTRTADVTGIGISELQRISECFAEFDVARGTPKTAAIIDSVAVRALARLYRAVNLMRKRPVEIKAFGDMPSTLDWLGVDVDRTVWR